tara:strand:- start:357 stop:623 length:267 start_codon:yes stop_codon:yes gene_type:complete
MDRLFLFLLLLLGAAPGQPLAAASAGPARAQAVASARILGGQAIAFGQPARPETSARDGRMLLPAAPTGTTVPSKSADGRPLQLQEFQ